MHHMRERERERFLPFCHSHRRELNKLNKLVTCHFDEIMCMELKVQFIFPRGMSFFCSNVMAKEATQKQRINTLNSYQNIEYKFNAKTTIITLSTKY